jgi:hypothetical protein
MAWDPEENERRAEEDDGDDELDESVSAPWDFNVTLSALNCFAELQGAKGRCDIRH